ncbi:WD40 domain protein beta Propeller [Rippkaea orientalis PCC 8801]|uniref:WD40 domain protein beta Propeller n=1 Tax=Rippkaea orientalis (strain PCC 8801 / RF-1) TaxID=41431 RepID=B7K617_RIPO1|nr:TolB family protein [Rippkaea orientalis]ACK68070.1 WD40 domain protein beta Propeller [Rippkaea orientalis PCC 8801]
MKPRRKRFHQSLTLLLLLSSLTLGLGSCQPGTFITPPTLELGSALNSRSAEEFPRFSYDGRYLVFASDRQGQRGIWLYDRLNNRLLPLPGINQPGTRQDQPDISSDGRYIVYVSEQEGKPDIFLYDRFTFQREQITKNWLGEVRHPTISGNGRLIAFEANRQGQWDLVIYDRGLNTPLSVPNPQQKETGINTNPKNQ